MLHEPSFWALAAGFALILLGISPLISRRNADVPELGCMMVFVGIGIVSAVTAVRALS